MKVTAILSIVAVAGFVLSVVPAVEAAPLPPGTYEYTDVDVQPSLKKPVRLKIPSSIRKKGEAAQIVLRFLVGKDGEVSKIMVVKFSHPELIESALKAYENAKYTPGQKKGQAVDTWMVVTEDYSAK